MSEPPLSIAVLISGSGTTLRNLIEKIDAGQLGAEIRLVISSRSTAKGLQYARDANIRSLVIRRADYDTPESFSEAVFEPCRRSAAALVVMGGYLQHIPIPDDFAGRVLNIHPSLIPAFCGQGFYGPRVHQAVLKYGAKVSGCTVHFVDNQYDHGPIILQRVVPVLDGDTPETLAARIFQQECQAYPDAIQAIADGRVRLEGRRVTTSPVDLQEG